jgi:hypothetical protein
MRSSLKENIKDILILNIVGFGVLSTLFLFVEKSYEVTELKVSKRIETKQDLQNYIVSSIGR